MKHRSASPCVFSQGLRSLRSPIAPQWNPVEKTPDSGQDLESTERSEGLTRSCPESSQELRRVGTPPKDGSRNPARRSASDFT